MSDLFGSSSDSQTGGDANKGKFEEELQELKTIFEVQTRAAGLTDMCWDKCMGSPGHKLDSKTETCMQNCVGRFVDVTMFISNRFAQILEKSQQFR